jgi:glyoxylase-like metal-dependent hydrolase (beta-lactamase superfamily II)/rhodanese-related sulfurtransferase
MTTAEENHRIMEVKQIYTGCLAQGAYYIESNGEVAIVDPLREVQPYIDLANERGANIKYVLETHFHADFVSGHVTLAEKTGAPIVFGPHANPDFQAHIATDGERLKLGNVEIEVLHTPGHTMESTTFLLRDEAGNPHAIFSGDTLFLGDVGRPDLAQKSDLTIEDLASHLYDSLRNKIMTLPDDTIVYPGHGAGSACGKNMSKETVGSIGDQKATNYALRADMTREEFIKEVTDGLMPPPGYFPMNVVMNKQGYDSIDEVMQRGSHALSPEAFEAAANETDAVMLDVRSTDEFIQRHVPRATFIGLNGGFAPWVGAMIVDVKQPILLIANEDQIDEAVMRLSRVGFDNILGYLEGGLDAWVAAGKETDCIQTIDAHGLAKVMQADPNTKVVDVRKDGEYLSEHVQNAIHVSLEYLVNNLDRIPKEETFYLHCAGGYRSLIAHSVLKAKGYHHGIDVLGGFKAISESDVPKTDYVCPSTLK